jgi:hypothetical protein
MKNRKIIAAISLLLICGISNSQNSKDNTLADLESKSITSRIAASNHVNSMIDRYKSSTRGSDGNMVPDAYYAQAKSIYSQSSDQIAVINQIQNEVEALQLSAHPLEQSAKFFERIRVLKRDISCTDFALRLTLDHDKDVNRLIALANYAIKECKSINDKALK